jgi:hypothetical protein
MSTSTDITLERTAELLRLLPPAPPAWVAAAKELPAARASLDALVARATEDAALRARVLAGLEQALAAEGIEPRTHLVDLLRRRLDA